MVTVESGKKTLDEGETEKMGICTRLATKERKGMTAEVLMATPRTDPWEREGWVSLKIPRGDIDGLGEVK